jgi:hypothetical protein
MSRIQSRLTSFVVQVSSCKSVAQGWVSLKTKESSVCFGERFLIGEANLEAIHKNCLRECDGSRTL